MYEHQPVMLAEVLEYLNVKAGDLVVDGTLGGASYTLALSRAVGDSGRVLAIDLDDLALDNARQLIKENKYLNITLKSGNFRNITELATEVFGDNAKVNGIVVDLGLSSVQLADKERGFSFQGERPLEMAFGEGTGKTKKILAKYSLLELTRIFRDYGDERFAYQIAKKIVEQRKSKEINNTKDLVDIILSALPARFRASRLNPATKVFQALRIETNQELEALEEFLPAATDLLAPGGRLVVVSFHSGEDRLVKNFFRDNNKKELDILTKKPIVPSSSEIETNPRARSAKLRAAQKR